MIVSLAGGGFFRGHLHFRIHSLFLAGLLLVRPILSSGIFILDSILFGGGLPVSKALMTGSQRDCTATIQI